jgi:hypothetical protein
MIHAAAVMAAVSGVGVRCPAALAATASARRWTSMVGMSIATGQTS